MHSYFPPLSSHLAGGAQQFVRDLLLGFARRSVDMEILCPDAEGQQILDLGPLTTVSDVQIEPRDGPLKPYERLWNARNYVTRAEAADVVLTIDRGVPAQVDVPVVLCLNNFSYATEVDAVFGLEWDEVVVPSAYLADCVTAVVGPQMWKGRPPRIHTIPYGVDTAHYRWSDPEDLRVRLGLDPRRRFLLFPHRPDPAKGAAIALASLARAARADPGWQLLVPLPPRSVALVRDAEQRFAAGVRSQVAELGISEHVVFHQWIPAADMPAYYSLGTACLALGTFPETFGFTPVQSIACGTPAVATPAGAVPSLLPPGHGLTLVPFHDPVAVAAALGDLPDAAAVRSGRAHISAAYSVESAVDGYLDALGSAQRRTARYHPAGGDLTGAPWCRSLPDGGRWHDYQGAVIDAESITDDGEEMQRRGLRVPRFGPAADATPYLPLIAYGSSETMPC